MVLCFGLGILWFLSSFLSLWGCHYDGCVLSPLSLSSLSCVWFYFGLCIIVLLVVFVVVIVFVAIVEHILYIMGIWNLGY